MKRFILLLAPVILSLSGCKSIPVAGECPESAGLKCLTRKVCTEDAKRGCMMCTCESPFGTEDIPDQDRQRGRSPDGEF